MMFSGKKANAKSLVRSLSNKDKAKRNQAARTLVELGAEGAEALMPTLSSRDAALRSLSAQILAQIRIKAIPTLHHALQSADSGAQQQAVAILGQIGDPAALPILLEVLPSNNYKLQVAAALALGKIGDKRALPKLLNTLSDSDPDVRIAVATAIGQFRMPQTYLNLADLLDDPEINVRVAAAQVLGKTGDASVIPYLVEALYDSFWWYGREQAITVLLEVIRKFGAQTFEPLSEALNAKEPTVRRHAISLLAPLKDLRSLEPLHMAFYDPNYDVAEMAARALIAFEQAAMPIFVEALASPNDWIREQAVLSIAAIGKDNAVGYLLELLNDSAPKVRESTIRSLGELKDARALPALTEIASHRSDREASRMARQAIAAIHAA